MGAFENACSEMSNAELTETLGQVIDERDALKARVAEAETFMRAAKEALEQGHAKDCTTNDPSCFYQAGCNCHVRRALALCPEWLKESK